MKQIFFLTLFILLSCILFSQGYLPIMTVDSVLAEKRDSAFNYKLKDSNYFIVKSKAKSDFVKEILGLCNDTESGINIYFGQENSSSQIRPIITVAKLRGNSTGKWVAENVINKSYIISQDKGDLIFLADSLRNKWVNNYKNNYKTKIEQLTNVKSQTTSIFYHKDLLFDLDTVINNNKHKLKTAISRINILPTLYAYGEKSPNDTLKDISYQLLYKFVLVDKNGKPINLRKYGLDKVKSKSKIIVMSVDETSLDTGIPCPPELCQEEY